MLYHRLKYWMIFSVVCISLAMGVFHSPVYAAGANNDPAYVNDVIQKASVDRRFHYTERNTDYDLANSDLWDKIMKWLEKLFGSKKEVDIHPGRGWGFGFGDINFNLSSLTYVLIVVAVGVVAYLIYRLVLYYNPRLRLRNSGNGGAADSAEILDPSGQRALAEKLMAQGRWDEALTALMKSHLLTLEARRLIRYHRSRTNREYLDRLRGYPILFTISGEFIHHFEEMKFGRAVPDGDGLRYMFNLYTQAEGAMPIIRDAV